MRTWKIGELARRTGLTVRTLHHYDEIGLLAPSYRTGAGHRLYTADDVTRLQMIVSLRQLDLPRLRQRIDEQQALYRRLEAVAERLRTAEEVSAEDFLTTMEMIAMYD